jgi:hypothetical protein
MAFARRSNLMVVKSVRQPGRENQNKKRFLNDEGACGCFGRVVVL